MGVPGNVRTLAGSSQGSGTGRSGVKSLSVDAGKRKDSDVGNCKHWADLQQSGASIKTVA